MCASVAASSEPVCRCRASFLTLYFYCRELSGINRKRFFHGDFGLFCCGLVGFPDLQGLDRIFEFPLIRDSRKEGNSAHSTLLRGSDNAFTTAFGRAESNRDGKCLHVNAIRCAFFAILLHFWAKGRGLNWQPDCTDMRQVPSHQTALERAGIAQAQLPEAESHERSRLAGLSVNPGEILHHLFLSQSTSIPSLNSGLEESRPI
jgi:hypothetical protein